MFFCSFVLGLKEFISTVKKGRIRGDMGNNSCVSGTARSGPWKPGWGYFPLPGRITRKEDQENHEHIFPDDKTNCEATGFLALLPSSRRQTAWHPPTQRDRSKLDSRGRWGIMRITVEVWAGHSGPRPLHVASWLLKGGLVLEGRLWGCCSSLLVFACLVGDVSLRCRTSRDSRHQRSGPGCCRPAGTVTLKEMCGKNKET